MANIKPKVEFESVQMKDHSGWYVRVTLPHGGERRLGGFKTDAEARKWIESESAVWLKGYESGKYV